MQAAAGSLVGRESECRQLDAVLDDARAGRPALLLVGGDAGVGKSALVQYLAEQAGTRGFTTLQGACLDLAADVPLRPVLEALRHQVIENPGVGVPERRLADIVREDSTAENLSRGEVVNLIRRCVDNLAAEPLVLILEDLHWSEQSSRDLVLTLSRSMPAHLVLVLTFRADDLHRRHPFRSCLRDLSRSPYAQHIDVGPLDLTGVGSLVEHHTGGRDPGLAEAVFVRSEGNPLYAEELIAAAGEGDELPDRLADLLLHRVDALSESTRTLLRYATVAGSRVDVDLITAVSSTSDQEIELAVREGLDFNVLVRRGDHVEFRHGLIREAVYDDLLPSERARLHASFAAALSDVDSTSNRSSLSRLSQLAFHCYQAHDLQAALVASLQAGLAAKRLGTPEAGTHLDRVLELWDQVPDAAARAGIEKSDVSLEAAEAAFHDEDLDRTHRLMRSTLQLIGPDTDPLAASRVYTSYCLMGGPGELMDRREAMDLAVEYAEGPPSDELAMALATQARQEWRFGSFFEAESIAARAIEVAHAVDNPRAEATAREVVAGLHMAFGRFQQGRHEHARAVALRVGAGFEGDALVSALDRAWMNLLEGDVALCVESARSCAARARELGQEATWFFAIEQVACARVLEGRLDEAEVSFREMYESLQNRPRWDVLMAQQLRARGDVEGALRMSRSDIDAHATRASWAWPEFLVHHVTVLLDSGLVEQAAAVVTRDLEILAADHPPIPEATVLMCGFATVAAARAAGRELPEGFTDELAARRIAQEASWDPAWDDSWYGGNQATARAWAARAERQVAPELWQAAVDIWERLGMRLLVLASSVELADDLLAAARREEARTVLLATWSAARSGGMQGVATRTALLARRHRITLPDSPREPDRLGHLTPREQEVLDILATGASNQVIADRLFISKRTASVHVSNVLAKLGVSSRGEAAALAREVQDG